VSFWFTFNLKVSRLFRPYSFSFYFLYFILEGNTQTLVFYASSSLRHSFSANTANRLLLSLNYLCGFFFLLFCLCGYVALFTALRRFLKYFLDNISKCEQMVLFLTLTLGVKNLLLGFVHSYFRRQSQADTQLALLFFLEVAFMLCHIAFLSRDGFEFRVKVWLLVLMQQLRLLFIALLFLQQNFLASPEMLQLCESVLSPLLKFYSRLVYVGILVNFLLLLS
jgi:hypothetical protein